jgi:hypothetical protein
LANVAQKPPVSDTIAALLVVPAAVTKELFAFGACRMKANAEHWQRMLTVKTPNDYIYEQMKFAADTMADYAGEATKLQAAAQSAIDQPQ